MLLPFAAHLLASFALFAGSDNVQVLQTSHYTITISSQCPEGDVGCDHMLYHSVSTSGQQITLHGKQLMQMCADKVTPCHSLGYLFRNGNVTYFVSEGGELEVKRGKSLLLHEQGTWK